MTTDISLSTLMTPLRHFISRYHLTIFLTIIGLLLAFAIFLLYLTLQIPNADNEAAAAPSVNSTFTADEKQTIKQIDNLRMSSDSANMLKFPSPRGNPFSE